MRYLEEGTMMPDDGLNRLASHDAILLGAVGRPEVPDHVTLGGLLLPIRKGFDQRICKRPSVLFEGIEGSLLGYSGGAIDFVVFWKNTESEYATARLWDAVVEQLADPDAPRTPDIGGGTTSTEVVADLEEQL